MTTTMDFHEQVVVALQLGRNLEPGEINMRLRSLGFVLHYDVYSLPRPDPQPHPIWQSQNLVNIDLRCLGEEVDAQEPADTILLRYPLARLDSTLIEPFIHVVDQVQTLMGGCLSLQGQPTDGEGILAHLTRCILDLMTRWGEEPGSEVLAMMIEGVI